MGAGDVVGALGSSGTPQIRSRAQGIFQNVTDPSEVTDERVNVTALIGVAAGSWLVAGFLMAVVRTYRRKSGDRGLAAQAVRAEPPSVDWPRLAKILPRDDRDMHFVLFDRLSSV